MKRLVSLLASLALAVGMLAFAPIATATGNCGIATVYVYSGPNKTGSARAYCYGVNDVDMESEPGLVLGPLADGNFYNDFDSGSTTSGISSAMFLEVGTSHAACFYLGKDYVGFAGKLVSGHEWVNFTGSADNAIGSFRFITGSTCSGGTGG